MKKIISIIVIIMITFQTVVLYLFFTGKLSSYPVNLIDILWIGSALLGILFGIILNFFTCDLSYKIYKKSDSKFTIFPVKTSIISNFSIILGILSIGLYLLMTGITSM